MQERLKDEVIIAQVRRRLEAQEGMALPAARAAVGKKPDGTQRQHMFDLVAENGTIVGEVRTYTIEGSSRPSGKFAHCYAACLYLYRARARRKLLVLTDHAFWSRFRREGEGLIEGIEVIHVPIDDLAPIMTEEAAPADFRPARPPRAPGRAPTRAPGRTSAPRRDSDAPPPRRNKGGPGPRGRHPNTGPRRGG
jgi:hypothetical protein